MSTLNFATILLCRLFKAAFKLSVLLLTILLWFLQALYSIIVDYNPTTGNSRPTTSSAKTQLKIPGFKTNFHAVDDLRKEEIYHSLPLPTQVSDGEQKTLLDIDLSYHPAKISSAEPSQVTSDNPLPQSHDKYHRSNTTVSKQQLTLSSLEEIPSELTASPTEIKCTQQDSVTESNRLAHYKEELDNILTNMFPAKCLGNVSGAIPLNLQDEQSSEGCSSSLEMKDTSNTTHQSTANPTAQQFLGTDMAVKISLPEASLVLPLDTKTATRAATPSEVTGPQQETSLSSLAGEQGVQESLAVDQKEMALKRWSTKSDEDQQDQSLVISTSGYVLVKSSLKSTV